MRETYTTDDEITISGPEESYVVTAEYIPAKGLLVAICALIDGDGDIQAAHLVEVIRDHVCLD